MKLTKRGERAFFALLLTAGAGFLALIFHLSISIHWTEEGYCYGTFQKCYEGEGEGKR